MSKLTRSSDDRMFAGVLSGIANWLGWDVTLLRIAFTFFAIFSAAFPGIIVYLILWVLMPENHSTSSGYKEEAGS